MDALIRLDVLMPIAPLTENSVTNSRRPTTDNFELQHTSVDSDNLINLDEMPDLIDLTVPQGEGLPIADKGTRPTISPIQSNYSILDQSVLILDEDNGELSGAKHRTPTKHKLAPLNNHSPSKVARTDSDDLSLALINSNSSSQSFSRPTTSHEPSNPIRPISASSIMKNHTVTSADINNDLRFVLVASNLVGTNPTNSFGPNRNSGNAPGSGHLSKESLTRKEPNNLNSALSQNVNPGIRPSSDSDTQTKPRILEPIIELDNSPRENKEKESAIFYQLLDMFPDIDLDFLGSQCRTGLDIYQVSEIILGMNGYPKAISETSDRPMLTTKGNNLFGKRDETNHVNGQFNFLMEIFPDADPSFMETKSKLNDSDLRKFIAESMEKNDYPKVTVPVKIEKEVADESSEIGLYTTNFYLENFLKIFPDPFGYFLDDKRNCLYSEHGFGFLKRRYRCHAIKLISLKYKEFKYNLVKTCEFLDVEQPSRSTKRGLNEIRMPEQTNLPFLQEACFIEHKTEIKKYLDGIAEAKRRAYEEAEAKGELIECGCCYQNVLFEDCATCNEGHLFCKACVQKSVEVRIGDAHTTFPCLQDCDSVFSLQLLEALVDATLFSRLLQRIQLDEVRAADIEGLEVCPFCDFAIILPAENNIFSCLNPECLKESCRKCHKLNHIPQRCEELENDDQARARKYIEDEMTRALVRVCYKCKKSFIKVDGCNKMTCTCGAKMCYICREPIVDYKHFNGPGGDQNNKCPLYSTEKLLHVDAVEAVAKKALEEVTAKNPELKLKHDPTKILPAAEQAKTTLPPGVNEEAERLMNVLQNLRQMNAQAQRGHAPVQINLNNEIPPVLQAAVHAVPRVPVYYNGFNIAQQDQRLVMNPPTPIRAPPARVHLPLNLAGLADANRIPHLRNQAGVPPNHRNQPH